MPKLTLRPLSEREQQITSQLSALDLSELYQELGQQLGTLETGENPETMARSWLDARRDSLFNIICVEGRYCSFMANNRNARTAEIVGSLSDLLAPAFGGIPIYTLTMLLVRTGLDEFCNCNSER